MGAYDLLLDWCYSNEKPLPARNGDTYRIARASTKAERANVDRVLADFFILTDEGYTQKRVLEEMAKANAQAETNRRIAEEREARKRARTEHESFNESSANRSTKDQPSQTPDTRHQEPEEQEQKQKGGKPPALTLPDWLPADVWADWHAYRNTRKGWTAHARKLSLNSLCELHAAGHDPRRVIELAIERGWTGLFAPRDGSPGSLAKPVTTRQIALEENNRNVASRWAQESDEGNKHAA
jgi:uncharacterized protein YdaU (DUF1376 family)